MRYLAVLIALALSLMGCGGSDGDTDSPTTSTTAADSGATPTSQPTTTTTTTTTEDSDNNSSSPANCPELMAWVNNSVSAINPAFGGGGTSTEGAQFTADFFQEFADGAPGEISDEMQTFADAYTGFYAAIEDLDFDFFDPAAVVDLNAETMLQLEQAVELMDTPEVTQARDNIQAFFDRECS